MHPNSLANLRPAKKGEVRNPKGINGVTKLQELAEALLEKTLEGEAKAGGSRLAVAIEAWVKQVERGRPHAQKLLFDLILPAVHKHEVKIPGADAIGLGDALASAAKSRRANGDDSDAHPGANGGSS